VVINLGPIVSLFNTLFAAGRKKARQARRPPVFAGRERNLFSAPIRGSTVSVLFKEQRQC
jgi:hypothetical protein